MPVARSPVTRVPLVRMNVQYQVSLTAGRNLTRTMETGPWQPAAQATLYLWKYKIHVPTGGRWMTVEGQHIAAHPRTLAPRTLWTRPTLVGTMKRAHIDVQRENHEQASGPRQQ